MCAVVLHSFFKAVFGLQILINLNSLFDMSVKDQWYMMIPLHLDDTALSSLTLSQAHASCINMWYCACWYLKPIKVVA